MATLNELVIAMGFDVKSESFQTFSKLIGGIDAIKNGLESVGKLATGGKGLKDFILGSASKGQDLINMSKNIGMSTDAIQQWQYAAEKAGVSGSAVMGDLTSLTTRWRRSQQGVLALAKQIKNASPFMVQAYKNMYGLSDDMITLLRRGPDEIKRYMDEVKKSGGIVSEENLQKGKALTESLTAVKKNLQGIAETVASEYMPKMQEMSNSILKWLQDTNNQSQALRGLEIALGALAASSLLSGLATLAINIKMVAGALGALEAASAAFLASPIGMVLTGIGALGLGLWNFFEDKQLKDRLKDPFGYAKNDKEKEQMADLASKIFEKDVSVKKPEVRSLSNQLDYAKYQTPVQPVSQNNVGDVNVTILTNSPIEDMLNRLSMYGVDLTLTAGNIQSQ